MFGPANGLSLALSAVSVLIAGVTVLLAYFDVRRLRATGFERPFPWPWAFFSLISGVGVLVYVIGRTVLVRRRSGHGVAPLVVAIAIVVIGISSTPAASSTRAIWTPEPRLRGTQNGPASPRGAGPFC